MAKQLNQIGINLQFTANTSQAKAQLQSLQEQLSKITSSTGVMSDFALTKDIREATTAAAQLQAQLKSATNINTGTLDLTKFSESLSKSGMSLQKYQAQLSGLGRDGQEAFAMLAQSITMAEIPLARSNTLATQLWTTLKNTARWQISSSALHAFMGAIQSAYGYAQDLNESLNNIRIVTGYSTDKMADFAKEANAAAKALSTTTTEYTDAALIFYQQGLNDQDVKARTDVTIKMANVARESADEVSSYMTAVWNNFNKEGEYSEEHFADVMTKLGATTASSTAEIANGLEKFASIADTIGLSFDYAASSLATIVATTRQSEDVVGTALKTIFARIQGLKLGETLDDGTSLNKYSEALQAVGISIFDQAGQLKNMDNILDEMGAKWQTLSKDQQLALAQTVAGVRQYNQLVALMDNWDFMQTNLNTAVNADGELQKQADIYAESWEAARDRVRASAEEIYSALLNDDFFIDVENSIAKLLDVIGDTIEGLGGVKGVLLTLGAVITQVFQKQIAQSLSNFAYNLKMSTKAGRQAMVDMKIEANERLIKQNVDQDTPTSRARASAYAAQGNEQIAYINNAERMSEEERTISKILMDRNRILGDEVTKSAELQEQRQNELQDLQRALELDIERKRVNLDPTKKQEFQDNTAKLQQAGRINKVDDVLYGTAKNIDFGTKNIKTQEANLTSLKASIDSVKKGYAECGTTIQEALGKGAGAAFDQLDAALQKDVINIADVESAWEAWTAAIVQTSTDAEQSEATIDNYFTTVYGDADLAKQKADELKQALYGVGEAESDTAGKTGVLGAASEQTRQKMEGMKGAAISLSTALTQTASTLMSVGMMITSINGLIEVWKDEDADVTTKLTTTLTTLGMIIPTLTAVGKGFQDASTKVAIFGETAAISMWQVTLIVGAVVALIAVFAILAKKAREASPEGQFKAAAKAAEEAADAAAQVAQEYENVKSALDDLDSGIDTINELAKGTVEWRNAINKSNASLIDLLSTYRMLDSKNFTTDADGVMKITDAARKELLERQANAVEEANNAKYMAEAAKNTADSRNKASQASADIITQRPNRNSAYDAVGKNSQLSSDIGMAIAKAINNNGLRLDDKDAIMASLASVSGLTDQTRKSVAQQIASNGELQQSLTELSATVAANTETNRILNGQIIKSKFGNEVEESGLSESDQGYLTDMMGVDLEKRTNELYESEYKDKGTLGGGKTDTEVQKAYAEAMGWATDTIENKSGNKAVYYQKDGTTVGTISDDVARKYLAQQAAIEEMQGSVDSYIESFQKLTAVGNNISAEAGNAVAGFVGGHGGSFEGLSDEDRIALMDAFSNGEFQISDEEAAQMGYENAEAYQQAVQDALTRTHDDRTILESSLGQFDTDNYVAGLEQALDVNNDVVETYAEMLQGSEEFSDALKDNDQLAKKMAIDNIRLNKGLESLSKNWENNYEALKDDNDMSYEYAEALTSVKSSLKDVFGVDVSNDFVKQHLEDIQKVAEGDMEALDRLSIAAAKDYVANMEINVAATDPDGNAFSIEECRTKLDEMIEALTGADLSVGATVDTEEYFANLNQMLAQGQITAEQANAILGSIGYQAEFETDKQTKTDHHEIHHTMKNMDGTTSEYDDVYDDTYEIEVPKIKGATYTGPTSTGVSNSNRRGGSKTVKSGGGNQKKDKKKASDEIDRYHEINEAIDDTNRELERLNKNRSKAYGKNALNLLDKEISKTKDLIKQKEKLLAEEQEYIKTDKEALLNAASSMGITVDIDATTGRILNYNEAIKAALEIYNATLTDEAEEQYELFKSVLTQYEETLNLIESTQEEIEDYRDEILSKNYEKITYKLEIEVSLSENELKEYEYYFNKLSEDIYTTAEAMAYLTNQIQATEGILDAYNTAFNSLTAAYNAGEISQADYADGLQNCYDNIMSNIEALDELDDQMKHYYGETLAKAVEELSHYTDRLGHLSEVADHYQKILELTNNKKNYEMTSKLLKTQENLAKNSYDAAKAWYESRKKAGAEIISNWNSVKDDPKAKNYDFYKQQYLDYIEELEKAESDMLDKAEALGEALKETLSNAMAEAAYNMEQALSGTFNTFDELNNAIKNMSSNVEEYLTKTNQIYETNKLLNKIGQDVQKTDNTAAKQKYAAFAEEIKQLQQKDQLSNLELEIANAKYDVLQKQIALEEAQNAKTTVRLSRDSEGNYGYVYTADDEKITQAEQDLQDAENALYNIRLKATNDYGQKRLQAQQDLANTLLDIDTKYQEGAYETEEQWQAARANAIAQYTTLITTYGNLYGIAQEDDARVVQDAWVNSFTEITTSGNNWQEAIEGYCTTTQEALEAWETATHDIKEVTEKDLNDLTTAGEDLADEIIEDVVPALDTELATALKNSQDYLEDERDSVLATRDAYLELAASIREAIAAEAERSGTPSDNAEKPEEETPAEEPKGEEPKPAGGDLSKGSSVTVKSTATHFSRDGGNGTRMQSWVPGSAFTVMQISGNEVLIGRNGGYTGWIKKTDLEGFKTGGYTGDWGTEGKLALLHKKELVLNKQDTSNILASVEIMRELTRSIDTQAGWASTGLGMLHAATAGHNPDILEQQVTITAEFPNATDHNEIEEAFNSLINRASQYANRY